MKSMSLRWLVSILALLCVVLPAWGAWDSHLLVIKPPPSYVLLQAEEIAADASQVVEDANAWQGKAVKLSPGGSGLVFEQSLPVGQYALYVIMRMARDDERYPAPPIIVHLRVTDLQSGQVRQWRTRIAGYEMYQDTSHLYFPVHQTGTYRIEFWSDQRSRNDIFVDYVDLKDVLGNLPRQAQKTSQNLLTPEELAALRQQPAAVKEAQSILAAQRIATLDRMADQQLERWKTATFKVMWDIVPPANLHHVNPRLEAHFLQWIGDEAYDHDGARQWTLTRGLKPRTFERRPFILPADVGDYSLSRLNFGPWQFEHPKNRKTYGQKEFDAGQFAGEVSVPDDGTGFFLDARKVGGPIPLQVNYLAADLMQQFEDLSRLAIARGNNYQNSGNELIGWEGACALAIYVHRYPQIDFQTQRFAFDNSPFGNGTQADYNPYGKFGASGSELWVRNLIIAYDQLFPVIQNNQQLADLLGQHIAWIKTPEDVIRLLDVYLLQHVRDCVDRQVIRGYDGRVEELLATAAVVQGPGSSAAWMWDLVFTRAQMRMHNAGGLQDHMISSINSDGTYDLGTTYRAINLPSTVASITDLARRYVALGGQLPADLSDVRQYPAPNLAGQFAVDMLVAGGFLPRIGDGGGGPEDPIDDRKRLFANDKPLFLNTWRATGDPRMAWMVHSRGRTDESDELWTAIDSAANSLPQDPVLMARTRQMPGFGMMVLEAHPNQEDFKQRQGLVMRTGLGFGASHADTLALTYYSHGLRMIPDTGRRGATPDARSSRVHHTLEIDEKDLNASSSRGGIGWSEALADLQGIGYARATGWGASHPDLSTYRRQTLLIPIGVGDAYAVDLFRAAGGKIHTWSTPGPSAQDATHITFNTPMSDRLTDLLKKYPGEGYENRRQGQAPSILEVTWDLQEEQIRRAWSLPRTAAAPAMAFKLWMLGCKDAQVIHAYGGLGDGSAQPFKFNFVHLRREATTPISDSYLAVFQGVKDNQPTVISTQEIDLPGAGPRNATAARALRVETTAGRDDLIYLGDDMDAAPAALPGDVRLQGQLAVVSIRQGKPVQLAGVGSGLVQMGETSLEPSQKDWRAKVTGLDVHANTITLDQSWPAGVLDGQGFTVIRQGKAYQLSMTVAEVDGKTLRPRESLKVYQSAVKRFDADDHRLLPETVLMRLEAQQDYYDGLAMVNEAGSIIGRAKVVAGDRTMYLGYPEHWQWKQKLAAEDIAGLAGDGEGKVVFPLLAAHRALQVRSVRPDGVAEVYPIRPGEKMADLEITRVSDDGLHVWFKNPKERYADNNRLPNESQPYVGQYLVTKTGRKVIATFPGTETFLTAMDRPLEATDLPDPNDDGRTMIYITHLAPGDVIEMPTFASASQIDANRWQVKANTATTLTISGQRVEIPLSRKLSYEGVTLKLDNGKWALDGSQ